MHPSELHSFTENLAPSTVALMFAEGPFDDGLYPIFNAYRFPVLYHETPNLSSADRHAALTDLFNNRAELELDHCHQYNQYLLAAGFVPRVPLSLRGVCTKDKATCKNFHKWSCGGCGRTFLPGSLVDPACVVHQDPWWMDYIGDEVRQTVAAMGGISKTDPLVYFPVGPKRHGRTQHFDPLAEI